MNISPDQPTLSETLAEMVRADDEHADRYGEDPDPLVRRNWLERTAARLAWEARVNGRPALPIGNAEGESFRLEVVAVGDVCGPVAVAGLSRSDGTFVGAWPWDSGVKIWPDEMIAAGLGSIELAAMESGISPLPLTEAEDIKLPWEELADGGAS